MRTRTAPATSGQAGFSMIEMLMTAFVLAIGLLGLCLLQTMSLRGGRGSRSLTTAVRVASAMLDQVEMEGRLSWLNINGPIKGQTNANLGLQYITLGPGKSSPDTYYNVQGNLTDTTSADPTVNSNMYDAVVTYVGDVGNAAGTGQISNFSVTVAFTDAVGASNQKITRQVVLTRRITHG